VANIRRSATARIGDTVTEEKNPPMSRFPVFREAKAMVFAGLYPDPTRTSTRTCGTPWRSSG